MIGLQHRFCPNCGNHIYDDKVGTVAVLALMCNDYCRERWKDKRTSSILGLSAPHYDMKGKIVTEDTPLKKLEDLRDRLAKKAGEHPDIAEAVLDISRVIESMGGSKGPVAQVGQYGKPETKPQTSPPGITTSGAVKGTTTPTVAPPKP